MSAPKKPLDHLPKIARQTKYKVVLEDQAVDDYERAAQAVKSKMKELLESSPRRAAAIRSLMPATATPEDVEAGLQALRAEDDAELAPLIEARDAAEARLKEVTVEFTFKALGRTAWKALKKKHPAKTDEDKEVWEANNGGPNVEFSLQSIVPDLLEASIVEPRLSRAAILEIVEGDDWNDSEVDMLRNMALLAQNTYRPHPKG